jgi:hypothetical protein
MKFVNLPINLQALALELLLKTVYTLLYEKSSFKHPPFEGL